MGLILELKELIDFKNCSVNLSCLVFYCFRSGQLSGLFQSTGVPASLLFVL